MMKRVVKIPNKYNSEDKFILKKEYENFGIYQEKCPSGFFVSQSYLITNNEVTLVIPSYNNQCFEEILDMIDNYNETKQFGVKILKGPTHFLMHPSGQMC